MRIGGRQATSALLSRLFEQAMGRIRSSRGPRRQRERERERESRERERDRERERISDSVRDRLSMCNKYYHHYSILH